MLLIIQKCFRALYWNIIKFGWPRPLESISTLFVLHAFIHCCLAWDRDHTVYIQSSVNNHFLSTCYVHGTILGSRDINMNKTYLSLYIFTSYISWNSGYYLSIMWLPPIRCIYTWIEKLRPSLFLLFLNYLDHQNLWEFFS